ncbi:MAG TPA: GspE/PulE family protein [Fimbriimonadaceae bacterium]|nr:GspE/PulE family protein [Fimbriimonadaceae bacterium]
MNLDKPIAEIFAEEGYVSREELNQILASRQDTTEHLGDLLVRLGRITQQQNLKCQGLQLGVPFVDLARTEVDPDAALIVPHSVALRLLAIPIERTDVSASVAMVNPLDLAALDELAAISGLDVDPMLATEEDVRDAIYRSFGAYDDLGEIVGEAVRGVDLKGAKLTVKEEEEAPVNTFELRDVIEGAPVIKLANALLVRAISMRASDVHIEPQARRVRIRFRIDGLLQEVMAVPKDLQNALASRIKIIANLDIAERRLPQDGRCTLVAPQGEFDFRVSTYPSVHGESIVIRILNKQGAMISLERLGMSPEVWERFLPKIEDPQGLVIVSGPTGSGKTTSLYAAVHHLNAIYRNIITIEDPVEYQLEGVIQGNVNPKSGITFANGLRTILRQDPDVILVGEIRDGETASIAIEAALTGHLVLTSLHANGSASALMRLQDMGIEPFLLGASVTCSMAQRLVRLVCPKCSEQYSPEPAGLEKLELPADGVYMRGRGCEHCARSGYRGRIAIYEVLDITSPIRRLILSGAHPGEIRDAAVAEGMPSLKQDACSKILAGQTTIEEVIRVIAG